MKLTPQDDKTRSRSVFVTNAFRGRDEVFELGGRVMRCDPSGAMSEQILSVLKGYTCRSESSTEGVFEVMHAEVRQTRACPSGSPG